MTIEQVSDLIKSVGLVIAGLWTAWTFYRLQKVRDASLEIVAKQKRNEEQVSKLLGAQPQLGIQLHAVEMPSPVSRHKSVLSITATLSNLGTKNLEVRFREHTLSVAKVDIDEVKLQSMGDVKFFAPLVFDDGSDEPETLLYRVMRVGQARNIVLVTIPVDEPCAYFIQFLASYWRVPFDGEAPSEGDETVKKAREKDRKKAREKGGGPPDPEGAIRAFEQIFCVVTGKIAEGWRSEPEIPPSSGHA